jgi:hypothetical protein
VQCSAVQFIAVQCSAVQCSAVTSPPQSAVGQLLWRLRGPDLPALQPPPAAGAGRPLVLHAVSATVLHTVSARVLQCDSATVGMNKRRFAGESPS